MKKRDQAWSSVRKREQAWVSVSQREKAWVSVSQREQAWASVLDHGEAPIHPLPPSEDPQVIPLYTITPLVSSPLAGLQGRRLDFQDMPCGPAKFPPAECRALRWPYSISWKHARTITLHFKVCIFYIFIIFRFEVEGGDSGAKHWTCNISQ